MAQMFERDTTAFTEAYDPNAEPGATADADGAAPSGDGEPAASEGVAEAGADQA
jgi:large subunit ribosomal protein L9